MSGFHNCLVSLATLYLHGGHADYVAGQQTSTKDMFATDLHRVGFAVLSNLQSMHS
jgi:hypothetical protein